MLQWLLQLSQRVGRLLSSWNSSAGSVSKPRLQVIVDHEYLLIMHTCHPILRSLEFGK